MIGLFTSIQQGFAIAGSCATLCIAVEVRRGVEDDSGSVGVAGRGMIGIQSGVTSHHFSTLTNSTHLYYHNTVNQPSILYMVCPTLLFPSLQKE